MGEEGGSVLVGWGVEFECLDEGVGTKVWFSEEEHSAYLVSGFRQGWGRGEHPR